jgi:hypothetical protein
MAHTSRIAEIVKKGWQKADKGWWVHKTAARQVRLPDLPLFVRDYPWERRGTNAPRLIASFSEEFKRTDLVMGGATRAEAATALLRAAMASPAKVGAA